MGDDEQFLRPKFMVSGPWVWGLGPKSGPTVGKGYPPFKRSPYFDFGEGRGARDPISSHICVRLRAFGLEVSSFLGFLGCRMQTGIQQLLDESARVCVQGKATKH